MAGEQNDRGAYVGNNQCVSTTDGCVFDTRPSCYLSDCELFIRHAKAVRCRWVETLQVGSGFMWEGLQIGLKLEDEGIGWTAVGAELAAGANVDFEGKVP